MTHRPTLLPRCLPFLPLACLLAVALSAQDLLPREQQALDLRAQGHRVAAARLLLEQAATIAGEPGDALAAARCEAWVTLACGLLGQTDTKPPYAEFEALGRSPLASSWPLFRDRLDMAQLELVEAVPDAPIDDLAGRLGLLDEFWLVGPFDNERGAGFRRSLPPEQQFDLDATLAGKRRSVSWRRLPTLTGARTVPLDRLVHPHEQSFVYCATAVLAASAGPVVLELGSTGSFRVFCNGQEAGAREVERRLRGDQDAVLLPLQAGPNLLLLKLCHQEGADFAFTTRLRSLDGAPLQGLRCSGEPDDLRAAGKTTAAPAAEAPVPLGGRSTWSLTGTKGADALRLAWLWQARAADGDLQRRDLAAAQQAVAELPQLPEAHLLLAAALRNERRSEADRDDNPRRRALEAALALAPDHVGALTALGHLLRERSNLWREARKVADRALQRPAGTPANGRAVLLRWQTLHEEGLGSLADRELQTAAETIEPELDLLRAAARTLEEQDPRRALQRWQQVLRVSHAPDDVLATANLLLRVGRTDAATDLLASELVRAPLARNLRLRLAEHLLATGDARAALQLLEAWLAIAPDDAEVMVFASRCWRQLQGSADDAADQQLALLRGALEVEPNRRDEERYAEFLAAAGSSDAVPFYVAYQRQGAAVLAADAGPPADAVVAHDPLHWVLRQRVIRANGNGTTSEYLHQIVRVLTEEGARQLADYRLPYWRGEQRARLLSCTIQRPDGQLQRPALRGAAVALPNLRPGDVVLVEGRIDDLAPSFFGDYFGLVHTFAAPDGSPVAASELVVLADPGRNYRHQASNGAPAATTATLPDGTLQFRWQLQNLPRDVPELRRPERTELEPVVRMTTYRDWDHFAQWWWNLIKNQLEVTPAMRATVQELCAGLTTDEAKIAAIYRFVTTDVRYEAWEFGVHGYKPYSTAVIHERRHGDCKDKALLLCALLGELGVACQPVLIFADPMRSHDELELAMVQHFNHCIAWLPATADRPGRFLDGTATWHPTDTLPEMDQGARVLVVDQGRAELREVPWTTPAENRTQTEYTVTLRGDGSAEVAVAWSPLGNAAVELRSLTATEPARRKEQLERRLGSLLGKLELQDVQSSDGLALGSPVVVTAHALVPELGQREGERWQLPSSWVYGDLQGLATAAERRTPLLLGIPSGDQQSVRYRLPAGWRIGTLPAPVQQQTPFGDFTMQWRRDGDQIVVQRTLEFARARIEPGDYTAFRDFIAAVKAADAQLVLLQKETGR